MYLDGPGRWDLEGMVEGMRDARGTGKGPRPEEDIVIILTITMW